MSDGKRVSRARDDAGNANARRSLLATATAEPCRGEVEGEFPFDTARPGPHKERIAMGDTLDGMQMRMQLLRVSPGIGAHVPPMSPTTQRALCSLRDYVA
jgi:hypothetical protein